LLKFAYLHDASIPARDRVAGADTAAARRSPASVEGPSKVLIADDDPSVRRMLSRAIERAGYQTLIAADVSEAIEIANEQHPRFALVDLHMPKGSGLDVIRSLRQTLKELHITLLSGDPALQARVDAFDAGADDYLAKPVYVAELIRRLQAAERAQDNRRALAHEKSRAEQLYVYAKEMASFLAHDLNNGFCVALSNVEYLRLDEVDEQCKDALNATLCVLHRMSVLTDNFLDIERLEEGALIPRRVIVPLHKLASGVLALNHTRRSDDVTTQVDCDPDLQVFVDGPLVERVLHNIVGNAMRYVHTGGEICVAARRNGPNGELLSLSVSNSGAALRESACLTMFEKFDRSRDGMSRHGLGLYFCRLVCEAHGGSIGVTSENGVTTIALEIPCV
jgi:two-component system sensor histidine kinase/response regulator